MKLDPSLTCSVFNRCVEEYHSDLSQRHTESCPWFNMRTCENLADPLSIPRSDLLNDFEERVNELLKLHVC